MGDLFGWLTSASAPAIAFIILASALTILIAIVIGAAFLQGREVSFWPPRVGEKPIQLLQEVSEDVKSLSQNVASGCSHLRYVRHRDKFNKIGIEILNGGVAGDTVYTVLRTGTFIGDFAAAISAFRSTRDTKLIVIVPDREIFQSNFGTSLQRWITDLYENPACTGVRGLVLHPGKTKPSATRMRGYLFISDGHVHEDDDGFYTTTDYAAKFVLGYFELLVETGTLIESAQPVAGQSS